MMTSFAVSTQKARALLAGGVTLLNKRPSKPAFSLALTEPPRAALTPQSAWLSLRGKAFMEAKHSRKRKT